MKLCYLCISITLHLLIYWFIYPFTSSFTHPANTDWVLLWARFWDRHKEEQNIFISFIHLLFKNINVSEGLYAIRNIVIPLALTANLAYYFDLKFEHCRSCAYMLSHFSCGRLSETLAHQAPLSMGFSRHNYQIGLSCHSPGDLPDPGVEPMSLTSPPLAGHLRMLL